MRFLPLVDASIVPKRAAVVNSCAKRNSCTFGVRYAFGTISPDGLDMPDGTICAEGAPRKRLVATGRHGDAREARDSSSVTKRSEVETSALASEQANRA
jgi:hypothetical protein